MQATTFALSGSVLYNAVRNFTTILEDYSLVEETSAASEPANSATFPSQALLWDESDFVQGRIQTNLAFREGQILKDLPENERLLGSINGVSLEDFIDISASRTLQERSNDGALLTPVELVHHVPKDGS